MAVYDLAKQRGVKPDQLTDADLLALAVRIRSLREVLGDGKAAIGSLLATKAGRTVPLGVYTERKKRCKSNQCGYAMSSASGMVACGMCGCSGEFMESALRDPTQACRLPSSHKLWDVYKSEQDTGLK